jgi:hypothetical protein
MESVGFKEWSLVCDALGRGQQSIILRKGGIAEGRGGFSFRYREFFLFPTFFHEQVAKVRIAEAETPPAGDVIKIRWYAKVERALKIHSLEIAEALAPLHILTAEVVRERFGYKGDGLNLAFVRIFEILPAWTLQNEKRFAGCRSWVDVPCPPQMKRTPVVSDKEHGKLRDQFDDLISSSRAKPRGSRCEVLKVTSAGFLDYARDDRSWGTRSSVT